MSLSRRQLSNILDMRWGVCVIPLLRQVQYQLQCLLVKFGVKQRTNRQHSSFLKSRKSSHPIIVLARSFYEQNLKDKLLFLKFYFTQIRFMQRMHVQIRVFEFHRIPNNFSALVRRENPVFCTWYIVNLLFSIDFYRNSFWIKIMFDNLLMIHMY